MEIDGGEVPILDGSAAPIIKALEKAGRVEQTAERDFVVIEAPIEYEINSRTCWLEGKL